MNRLAPFFATVPELICLDVGDRTLTLAHFGNVQVYNSLDPQLTLFILRTLKSPRSLKELVLKADRWDKTTVSKELKRLAGRQFVISYAKAPPRVLNSVLNDLAKGSEELLGSLTKKVSETRIGILDFLGTAHDLQKHQEAFGYKQIYIHDAVRARGLDAFLRAQDFYIVLGNAAHHVQVSKLNQAFFSRRKMWMLVMLDSFGGIVGPTFGLDRGPCFDCLIEESKRYFGHHFQSSAHVDLIECHEVEASKAFDFSGKPLAKATFPFVALETLKAVTKFVRPKTYDGFCTFDLFNLRMEYTVVSPSPLCPTCMKRPRPVVVDRLMGGLGASPAN